MCVLDISKLRMFSFVHKLVHFVVTWDFLTWKRNSCTWCDYFIEPELTDSRNNARIIPVLKENTVKNSITSTYVRNFAVMSSSTNLSTLWDTTNIKTIKAVLSYLVITLSEIFMLDDMRCSLDESFWKSFVCVCVNGGDGQAWRFIVSFSAHYIFHFS